MKSRIFLADVLIGCFCILAFILMRLLNVASSITSIAVCGVFGFVLHCITYYTEWHSKSLADNALAIQFNSILKSNDEQIDEYLEKLQELSNKKSEFKDVITKFIDKMSAFSRKESALKELIYLNGDKYKDFLNQQNESAQTFLAANLKKLVKSLIAYDAKSYKNRAEDISNEESVQQVLTSVNELIDRYDDLLEEVKRVGDDFNPEAPGIKYAIENLQQLRVGTEDELSDDFNV